MSAEEAGRVGCVAVVHRGIVKYVHHIEADTHDNNTTLGDNNEGQRAAQRLLADDDRSQMQSFMQAAENTSMSGDFNW